MLRGFFLLLVLRFTLLPACSADAGVDVADLETCDEVYDELKKLLPSVMSCTADSECGQVIKNSSCGCTHNNVARLDADLTRVSELFDRRAELECTSGATNCACEQTDGPVCRDGFCTWNITN